MFKKLFKKILVRFWLSFLTRDNQKTIELHTHKSELYKVNGECWVNYLTLLISVSLLEVRI
jgi:hypothetical protein